MSTYYWLASEDLPQGSGQPDIDKVMLPFIELGDDQIHRFCILMCTRDRNGVAHNSLLAEFLKNIAVTIKNPIDDNPTKYDAATYQNFLKNSLGRKEPASTEQWEKWTFYVFENSSPLSPFASTEVSNEAGATVLRIEPAAGNPWLQRPYHLTPGPDAIDLTNHFRLEKQLHDLISIWPAKRMLQFRLENNGMRLVVELTLPFNVLSGDSDTWFGLHFVGPVGQSEWKSGNKAEVRASASPIYVVFGTTDSNVFTIPWHPGHTQIVLTGKNLRLVLRLTSDPTLPWLRMDVLDAQGFQYQANLAFITKLFPTISPLLHARTAIDDELIFPARYLAPKKSLEPALFSPISIIATANLGNAGTILKLDQSPPSYVAALTFADVFRKTDPYRITTSDVNLAALGIVEPGALNLAHLKKAAPLDIPIAYKAICPVDLVFQVGEGQITLRVALKFDLKQMKLAEGPFDFKVVTDVPQSQRKVTKSGTLPIADQQVILNLGLFAIEIPAFAADKVLTEHWVSTGRHGYLDFTSGEIVFDNVDNGEFIVWLPGASTKPRRDKGHFPLKLVSFDPTRPLEDAPSRPLDAAKNLYLRINRLGVSLKGRMATGEPVTMTEQGLHFDKLMAEPLSNGADGTLSEFVIVDSKILRGKAFARMIVPGTTDLWAEVMLRISQQAPESAPLSMQFSRNGTKFNGFSGTAQFDANLRIAGDAKDPTADLRIGYFRAVVTNPRFGLAWNHGATTGDFWGVTALVDAALSVSPTITLQNGMTELRAQDSIVLKDVDLMNLSYKSTPANTAVKLRAQKFDFSVFGLVDIRLDDVELSWEPDQVTFNSRRAGVTFRSGDGMVGGVGVGSLQLVCKSGKIRVGSISGASVKLSVPGQFDFDGDISWRDNDEDSYFQVNGGLTTFGGFKIAGLLQFGSDLKVNGERVRSMAAFASRGNLNKMFLPWLWWQQGGLGAGFNRQLSSLSRNPSDEEILAKIDSLEPAVPENWKFVKDEDRYAIVVGRLVFTSQPAAHNTVCGFVLWTIASIDTTGRIIGAGKMWLFSSQEFSEQHAAAPSIVAALNLDLRKPSLSATAMTKKGGAIQGYGQLQEILNRTETLLTLRVMPNLFDVYLHKLQYKQEWLNGTFDFDASWRFSLVEETVLQYVRAKVRGHLGDRLEKGPGGFEFGVDLDAAIEYGGLIGREGAMTWGSLEMGINAYCSAWIEVEFSVPYVKCNGIKSCTDYRTVSETYQMPRQNVQLGISGSYAIRASEGVAAGAKIAVHFSRHICGHELSISPEIVVRADVLEDVQSKVRRFESQIDQVARESMPPSFEVSGLRSMLSQPISNTATGATEEWLLVVEQDEKVKRWVVLPAFTTPWLTPIFKRRKPSPNPTKPEDYVGFNFQSRVTRIEWTTPTSGAAVPAWDHVNWGDIPPPASATGKAQNLYRLNSLFAESGIDSDDREELDREAAARLARSEGRIAEPVIDRRPFMRLRDALTDEDRASLPADIYPFTYRRMSEPKYEKLCAKVDQRRNGQTFLEDSATKWRSARAASIELILDELRTGRAGDFSLNASTGLPGHFTQFIQSGNEPTAINVGRDGNTPTSVDLILLSNELFKKLRTQLKLYPLCQEPRAASQDGNKPDQVVVKLPVDFRDLFKTIDVKYKTTWFDLVDYVQIIRGESEVIADRVPLPVQEFLDFKDGKYVLQRLLHPFVFTDVVPSERKSFARYTPAPIYKLRVVPLGASGRLADPNFPDLTLEFPSEDLYVPAQDEFPMDLGLKFTIPPVLSPPAHIVPYVEIELIHTTSGQNAAEFPPFDDESHPFELFYQPRTLSHTGFYGRALELRGGEDFRPAADKSGRASRLSSEASGQDLVSTVGLLPIPPIWLLPTGLGKYQLKIDTAYKPGQAGERAGLRMNEGYLFYIRPAGAALTTPVRELPLFASRDASFNLASKPEPPQSVSQLELACNSDTGANDLKFQFAPLEASEADPRHRLLVDWTHPSDPNIGGVEIFVLDDHEKRIVLSRRVEVMTEDVFRRSQRDFREPDEWIVAPSDGPPSHLMPPALIPTPIDRYYWDDNRWFPAGSLLNKVKDSVADLAVDGVFSNDTFAGFIQKSRDFWTQVARFGADPQNVDSNEIRTTIREVRCGLIAVTAGLFPSGEMGQVPETGFEQLEDNYAATKLRIDQTRLTSVTGVSEDDQFLKRLDLLAARRLLALMEYRRGFMTWAVDGFADQDPPLMSLVDQLRQAARESTIDSDLKSNIHDRMAGWKRTPGNQLPEADVEATVFRDWLGITSPQNGIQEKELLSQRYPLSMWFFNRLVEDENNWQDWDDWRPGKRKNPSATLLGAKLDEFRTTINQNPTSKNPLDPNLPIRFVLPLQHCLCLTPIESGVSPSWDDNPFEIRPHHSLSFSYGQGADLFIKRAVEDELQKYLPPDGSLSTLLPILSPRFLNLLERFGMAVDVAYVDSNLGLTKQRRLVDELQKRVSVTFSADFQFYVCRGRTASDATSHPETEFSFVKLVAIPNDIPSDEIGRKKWFMQLLQIRKLTWTGEPPSDWFFGQLDLLRQIAVAFPSNTLSSLFLEHQGTAWSTVASVGDRCHIALTIPVLQCQSIGVRMRKLSRYELIADWLHWPKDSAEASSSSPVRFRAFYVSAATLPQQSLPRPFALATSDRFVFTLPPLPDQIDSRDNLLTLVRTGFRNCGIRFLERPVEQSILEQVLKKLNSAPSLLTHEVSPSQEIKFDQSLDVTLFSNETAIVVRNAPYYMESSVQIASHYEVCAGSAIPSLSYPRSAFLRRKPRRIANRLAFAAKTDNLITLTIPLVQYADCLLPEEMRDRPNDQSLATALARDISVRECPDIAFSYLLLHSADNHSRSRNGQGEDGDPSRAHLHTSPTRLLAPLLQIDLPLAAGYPPSGDRASAWVQTIGSLVEPMNNRIPILVRSENDQWSFGVQVIFRLKLPLLTTIDVANLVVIATRDGASTDPFSVKDISPTGRVFESNCDQKVMR